MWLCVAKRCPLTLVINRSMTTTNFNLALLHEVELCAKPKRITTSVEICDKYSRAIIFGQAT